jgi:hypothetical protein
MHDTDFSLPTQRIVTPPALRQTSIAGVYADETGSIWSDRSGPLRKLRLYDGAGGYALVGIPPPGNKVVLAHKLVCEAFHGPRPDAKTVAHINGIKRDNSPSNLMWATLQEQSHHKRLHGTLPFGDKCHLSKVSDADWLNILEKVKRGASQASVAREYGLTPQAVWQVFHGRARRHLTQPERT